MRRLILLACLAVGCGAPPPAPSSGPSELPPPDLSKRPYGEAAVFLELVRTGNIKGAHACFLPGRVSEYTFESELKAYRKAHATELGRARILTERVRGKRARVVVSPSWVLLYSQQPDGTWKLESCSGGPFGGPDIKEEWKL